MDQQAWSTSNPYAEMSSVRSNSNPVVAYPDVYVAHNTSDRVETTPNSNMPGQLWQQQQQQQQPPPQYNEILLKPEQPKQPNQQPNNPNVTESSETTNHSVSDLILLPSYESLDKE
jgi:hypothetical protein